MNTHDTTLTIVMPVFNHPEDTREMIESIRANTFEAWRLIAIDDGSDSIETSHKMLDMLKQQGIEQIIATPHFYAHRSKNIQFFLEKREEAYRLIGSPEYIRLGAEVAIEHGISDMTGIEKLAIQGSDLILLELPYTGYSSWMEEEIYNIAITYKLKPVIAHIHRYLEYYTKEQLEEVAK